MERITLTPFGRGPISLGQLLEAVTPAPADMEPVAKWQVFRALTEARAAYGVTDRELSVLNALLTFLPGDDLDPKQGLIVFPSNATLSARAHGMPESTLRRHLARLVSAGVIRRHDSPNGKRYARRDSAGRLSRAFGFDLSPLLHQSAEIAERALEARQQVEALKRLREDCVLLIRDGFALLAMVQDEQNAWDSAEDTLRLAQRATRRKPRLEALLDLRDDLLALRDRLEATLPRIETPETPVAADEMSGSAVENERHHISSDKDIDLSESAMKTVRDRKLPQLTVDLLHSACPELQTYNPDGSKDWAGVARSGQTVSRMMGIAPETWREACESMGPVHATATVGCILERFDRIRSPGAYLRHLSAKARRNDFNPMPMLLAQLTAVNRRATA
ncbi:hypothetical protein JYP51_16620 [Ponticoccus gilvus]|nr:hypothetical protein [Enemella evansiae]